MHWNDWAVIICAVLIMAALPLCAIRMAGLESRIEDQRGEDFATWEAELSGGVR